MSSARKLHALVTSQSGGSSAIGEMLDEIARLRGILERNHAKDCPMLRTNASCTCDFSRREVAAIGEINRLRAELLKREQELALHRREIARLDATRLDTVRMLTEGTRAPRKLKSTPPSKGLDRGGQVTKPHAAIGSAPVADATVADAAVKPPERALPARSRGGTPARRNGSARLSTRR